MVKIPLGPVIALNDLPNRLYDIVLDETLPNKVRHVCYEAMANIRTLTREVYNGGRSFSWEVGQLCENHYGFVAEVKEVRLDENVVIIGRSIFNIDGTPIAKPNAVIDPGNSILKVLGQSQVVASNSSA